MFINQKGFTYPLSLCMLLLFSTFVLLHTQLYLNEKKLAHETETILNQEYYLLSSVRKIESQLRNGEPINNSGVLSFREGKVDYIKEDLGVSLKITFTMTLNTGEKSIGFGYYDKNLKKMIKWVEKN
ncbi:competence type IV pilus minor pilin ComGG [Bacillus sp. 1NLA3E]|uniref:competence type IV pilus minor pilin ComGG n=1 Tax=Bacillus sp. 1NLA3E TaxID=666686 RepID=UPI000247E6F1|nr:competence type IV pilus minor pilin ComGG [Bacillus sp. 1NLA3E]AGK54879.1 DNA transport platform protein [Bacillus sp. 1NLA3E]